MRRARQLCCVVELLNLRKCVSEDGVGWKREPAMFTVVLLFFTFFFLEESHLIQLLATVKGCCEVCLFAGTPQLGSVSDIFVFKAKGDGNASKCTVAEAWCTDIRIALMCAKCQ